MIIALFINPWILPNANAFTTNPKIKCNIFTTSLKTKLFFTKLSFRP